MVDVAVVIILGQPLLVVFALHFHVLYLGALLYLLFNISPHWLSSMLFEIIIRYVLTPYLLRYYIRETTIVYSISNNINIIILQSLSPSHNHITTIYSHPVSSIPIFSYHPFAFATCCLIFFLSITPCSISPIAFHHATTIIIPIVY